MQKDRIINSLNLYYSIFSKLKWWENHVPTYFALTKNELEGCYSQLGQDFLIKNFYSINKSKVNFFIDVGAHDGLTFSNTYLFEKHFEWKGLCIEPNPQIFSRLRENRNCLLENVAVSDKSGTEDYFAVEGHSDMLSGIETNYSKRHMRRIMKEIRIYDQNFKRLAVETSTLKNLISKHKIKNVSFISIDTEGSELKVLKSIDFNTIQIDFIIIENNDQKSNIKKYLQSHNFFCAIKIESEEFYSLRENVVNLQLVADKFFQKKSFFRCVVGKFLNRFKLPS